VIGYAALFLAASGGSLASAGKPTSAPDQNIVIECHKSDIAAIRVGDITVTDPTSLEGQVALERLLPDKHQRIHITNLADTPWSCRGGLIYLLQSMGYDRVGFIAEPPSHGPAIVR
jgi:hypothetical protein